MFSVTPKKISKVQILQSKLKAANLRADEAELEKNKANLRADEAEEDAATAEESTAAANENAALAGEGAAKTIEETLARAKKAEDELIRAKIVENELIIRVVKETEITKKAERAKQKAEIEKQKAELAQTIIKANAAADLLKATEDAFEAEEKLDEARDEIDGMNTIVAKLTMSLQVAGDRAELFNTAQILYASETGQEGVTLIEMGAIRKLIYESTPQLMSEIKIMIESKPEMFLECISNQLMLRAPNETMMQYVETVDNTSASLASVESSSAEIGYESKTLGADSNGTFE